jgi:guanylate kinase
MSSNSQDNRPASIPESPPDRRGILIVVSSPSGGGKGTLIRRVLKMLPDLGYSVSYTTRPPRAGEIEGQDYFFVSVEDFRAMETAGEFLESAVVHGNLYATSHKRVEQNLTQGHDIVLEIDVQGAENVHRLVSDAVMIFVLPPSYQVLTERLEARGSEMPGDLALRLKNAHIEVKAYNRFDYIIINDDADRAANQLAAVILAERARRERQQTAAQRVLMTFSTPATSNDGT